MAEKKRVLVKVNDQDFTVVSEEEESYVVELASYVDDNIKSILSKNSKLSKNMVYILSAFNIANDFYKEKESFEQFKLEAKEPMENFDRYKREQEELREKYDELKSEAEKMKDELLRSKRDIEKLSKKTTEQEQSIKIKSNEVSNSEVIIKELQSKLFKEQSETVKLKKELQEKQ